MALEHLSILLLNSAYTWAKKNTFLVGKEWSPHHIHTFNLNAFSYLYRWQNREGGKEK